MPASRIYLDHAASAPLLPASRDAVIETLDELGNPSSAHAEGRRVKDRLEGARTAAAQSLGCRPRELVFTASGTLASQLAVLGAARARQETSRRVVLSAIEHPAVSEAADRLATEAFDVVRVAPQQSGNLDSDSFLDAVGEKAACAALMLANHETGACMPVVDVAAALRERGVPLAVDACLGAGRLDAQPAALGADLVVYSGHKLGAPPGIGLLYVRRRTQLEPLFRGGLQEEKVHPGTENVAGAAGLAAALQVAVSDVEHRVTRYRSLLARFLDGIEGARPFTTLTPPDGLAGLATIEFPGVEGEAAMINLDLEGVAVSTGSRCALGATEASPSLLAMGLSARRAASTLRVTTGEGNDAAQVDEAAARLVRVVQRLRALARR